VPGQDRHGAITPALLLDHIPRFHSLLKYRVFILTVLTRRARMLKHIHEKVYLLYGCQFLKVLMFHMKRGWVFSYFNIRHLARNAAI